SRPPSRWRRHIADVLDGTVGAGTARPAHARSKTRLVHRMCVPQLLQLPLEFLRAVRIPRQLDLIPPHHAPHPTSLLLDLQIAPPLALFVVHGIRDIAQPLE